MKIAQNIIFIICLFFSLSNELYSQYKVKNNYFSVPRVYKGTATPFSVLTINMGFNDEFRGIVEWTLQSGTFFNGPVFDINGKIIKKGDLLIKMKTEYRAANVANAIAGVEYAKVVLDDVTETLSRYKRLMGTNAISKATFQEAKTKYLEAQSALNQAKIHLILTKVMLNLCEYRAKFDGVVTKVFFPGGFLAGEVPVMEVAQLFPMGIDVKMTREEASAVNANTPIIIYPVNSDKPLGIQHGFSTLTDTGIKIKVNNYLIVPERLKKYSKEHPVINTISSVIPFNFEKQSELEYAVSKQVISKDNKGYFVWCAVGQKNGIAGKAIDEIFAVKKVYIKLGDEMKYTEPDIAFIELEKNNDLELNDVLVPPNELPENFKDGSMVCFYRKRYLFMPGDPVKVVIGGMPNNN